jgi:hypothetical protein
MSGASVQSAGQPWKGQIRDYIQPLVNVRQKAVGLGLCGDSIQAANSADYALALRPFGRHL